MFIRQERSLKEFIYAYPIVTCLIIINVSLWIIVYMFPFGENIYQIGAGHNFSIYAFNEYWRLFTPVFLHSRDIMHVLFNSFSLVLFGPALEQMLGKYKFIIAYLVMGIAGNVGTYLVDPTSMIPHIGASGAIYGIFGIYVYMVFFHKSLIDQANAQIVMTILIIGIVMTFIMPRINISAHIFGLIGGFAIAPLMLANAQPFSIYKNRRPPKPSGPGGVQFDPQRHRRRKVIPHSVRKNLIWIILGILVLIAFLGRI